MDELNATTAENPGSGSLSGVLDALGGISTAIGSTAGTLLQVKQNIQNLQTTREDRAFATYLRGVELDVAKQRAGILGQVEVLKAQGILEQTRAAIQGAPIRWDWVLMFGAIGVGVYALAKLARGR